jgi:hypothetical protein
MLDKKSAYTILGLDESATEEQVEQRYTVLLLRSRNRNTDKQEVNGSDSMEEITKAYNFIKGSAIEEQVRQKEPKNKTLGRIAYIWEYYRWHIFGTIAVVLIVFYTGKSVIDNRNEEKRIDRADLKITFFTDFQVQETDPFEVKLLEGITDWQDIHIVNQYAPTDPKDEYGMAMLQKAVVSMAADKADIYIMDKTNYAKFGRQEAFLKLDEIPALANIPQEKRRNTQPESGGEIWTGITVTDNAALKLLKLPDVEKIAVIRVNANKKENAAKALEWLGSN